MGLVRILLLQAAVGRLIGTGNQKREDEMAKKLRTGAKLGAKKLAAKQSAKAASRKMGRVAARRA